MKSLKHFNLLLVTALIFSCSSNPKWTTIETDTSCIAQHECSFAPHNDALYLIGDETEQKEESHTMFSFNLKNKTWAEQPSLNKERYGTYAALTDTNIYIASGNGNQGGEPELTSIEVYN